MNPLLDKMQKWINDGVQTLLSILKIVIYSKNKTPMPTEFDSLGELNKNQKLEEIKLNFNNCIKSWN